MDSDRAMPRVNLKELTDDELDLIGSIADLLRKAHGDRSTRDSFATLWDRIKAAPSSMDEESAMALALEAQRAVRRAGL
jgi:hypothetical protein